MSSPQKSSVSLPKIDLVKTSKRPRVYTEQDHFVANSDIVDNLQDDGDIPIPAEGVVLEKITLNPNSLKEVLKRQRLKHYHSVLGYQNYSQKLSQQKMDENNQSKNIESGQLEDLLQNLERIRSKKGFDLDMKLSPFFESIKIQSPTKSPRKMQLKPLAKIAVELLNTDKNAKERHKQGTPSEQFQENQTHKDRIGFSRQDSLQINFDQIVETNQSTYGSLNSSPRFMTDRGISLGSYSSRVLNSGDNRRPLMKSRFLQSLNTMPIKQ